MYSCNNEMEQTINEIKPYDTKAEISEIQAMSLLMIFKHISKKNPL